MLQQRPRLSAVRAERGFTLIELMIVVAIVGILAVLAVVGVRRYLANAKTAEARNALGAIGKNAVAATEKEFIVAQVMAAGGAAALNRRMCKSSTQAVPAAAASISGQKYQPNNASGADFHKDDNLIGTGFSCLRFEMTTPQSYQYSYVSDATDTTFGTNMTAIAIGDLNGNTTYSTFQLFGAVSNGDLILAPSLGETNPDE